MSIIETRNYNNISVTVNTSGLVGLTQEEHRLVADRLFDDGITVT